jgi:hypothetical protein
MSVKKAKENRARTGAFLRQFECWQERQTLLPIALVF